MKNYAHKMQKWKVKVETFSVDCMELWTPENYEVLKSFGLLDTVIINLKKHCIHRNIRLV